MASSTREPTSALGPASPVTTSATSPAAPATEIQKATPDHDASHHLSHNSNVILNRSTTPLSAKQQPIPRFELTGAAAVADQRRHEEELRRKQAANLTSPNPAKMALMASSAEPVSRPSDAPPQTSTPSREPFSTGPDSSIVAEPMQIDGEEQNGPMVTSSPEPGAAPSNLDRTDSKKRPGSPTLKNDDRSNKAFTYPPPPEVELPAGPARNMSLPNAGTRSPSTKKHRCPHCSTEFTRHHNLKSHLLTHSQEKPYGCEQCSQRFRRLHDLKRHLKLHTGERPHTCNVCGRKFARGDALARHNKGPGGCAGRRESLGGDDEYGEDGDVDMDGQYPGDDSHEGLSNDEQMAEDKRRKSEPGKRGRRTSSRVEPHGSNFRHSTNYPPVAPMSSGTSREELPPPRPSSTAQARDAPSSQRHLSPHPHLQGSAFNPVQYNGPSSMYAHGGMTESPKPLSPGRPDPIRHNSDASMGRNHSPSLATKLQHSHFRSTDGATPPINLPPPSVSSHQQLPSISGLDPRFNGSSYPSNSSSTYRPPMVSTQPGPGSSGPPSASSQHQSSVGSTREPFGGGGGGGGPQQDEARMMDYVRGMEARLHEEKTLRIQEREERDSIIRMLRHEMEMLKSQLPQPEHPQGHGSSQ